MQLCLFVVQHDLCIKRVTRLISGTKKRPHFHQTDIIRYYPSDVGMQWSADSWKPCPVSDNSNSFPFSRPTRQKIYALTQNLSYFRLNGSNLTKIGCKNHTIWVCTYLFNLCCKPGRLQRQDGFIGRYFTQHDQLSFSRTRTIMKKKTPFSVIALVLKKATIIVITV